MSQEDYRSIARRLADEAAERQDLLSKASKAALFGRLSAIEACRNNPFQPSLIWLPTAFGSPMQIDLNERVSQDIFLFGATEPDLLWFMTISLERGMNFYDCGAHFGFFTVAAGHLVGPSGQVDAFEPIAATKLHLDTNVRNAKLSNVVCHLLALWDQASTITLNDYGPKLCAFNSFAGARLRPGVLTEAPKKVDVPAVSLDQFSQESGREPDFIKIDVESAEAHVLRGMEKLLTTKRPLISLEVGDFDEIIATGLVPPTHQNLAYLVKHDYRILEISGRKLAAHVINTEEPYSYANLICVPTERFDEIWQRGKEREGHRP